MEPRVRHALRCLGCGDVIGVYEPATLVGDGRVRETSRAAEPRLPSEGDTWFHRTCYQDGVAPEAERLG